MGPPQRLDVLPESRRLAGLNQALLDRELDAVLQAIVLDAAQQVGTPIALVSMVLDDMQFFRAHHGLPDDLAAAQGTARDVSFCQIVVRDDALTEIEDARGRDDVPQALVDAYGIRAYLGVPIHLGEQALGTLCVIDTVPRTFTAEERALVSVLAHEVEARIGEWSQPIVMPMAMLRATAAPIFSEMRNQLMPLVLTVDELHLLHVELTAHLKGLRAGDTARSVMPDPGRVQRKLNVLAEAAGWVTDATQRLADGLGLLEGLVDLRRVGADAQQLVTRVDGLCTHLAETIGGVSWAPTPAGIRVSLPLTTATVTVSAVLNWLIARIRSRRPRGLQASVLAEHGAVIFTFSSPRIEPEDVTAIARELELSGYGVSGVLVEAGPECIRLSLPG